MHAAVPKGQGQIVVTPHLLREAADLGHGYAEIPGRPDAKAGLTGPVGLVAPSFKLREDLRCSQVARLLRI